MIRNPIPKVWILPSLKCPVDEPHPQRGLLSPQIPATMTAEELTFTILDRRKIVTKEKDFWSCFEVNEREEAGQWPEGGEAPWNLGPWSGMQAQREGGEGRNPDRVVGGQTSG